MLSPDPSRHSALVNAELRGGLVLSPKMGDELFVDGGHSIPPYGNAHKVSQGNTHLQGYGSAPDTFRMELKDRIKAARKHAKLTQAQLAQRVGLDQTSISNLEQGKSQGSAYIAQLAAACGVSALWLAAGRGNMNNNEEVPPGAPSEKDYALIPQYTARGECGDGYFNDHVETTEGLVFKRDWLKRVNSKPENLFVIYAEGDSMEPYIFEGDVVLFDVAKIEPQDKQVYVIRRPDGGVSIKRLNQQLTGAWLIRSDNPDKTAYPDEIASETSVHDLPIIGRVIWRGGGIGS